MHNGHLSIEQIENLSQQESQSSRQNSEDWSHVEKCDRCRNLVEKFRMFDARLGQLASAHLPTGSGMNCPDQNAWFEVAAGALPDEESLQYLEHAATCDECGKKLKSASQIFEQELTVEDELLLGRLSSKINAASVSLEVARRKSENQKPWLLRFWKPVAYAVSAFAVFTVISWNLVEAHDKKVLEGMYRQGRPTEYRLADLPYGPSRTQLGATEKRYLHISGHDPTYRAAAALLKLDSFSAIEILEKARDSGDTSKSVLNDLVVAYAMEYGQTGSQKYLQTALQLTNEVIQKYSSDPVAYFNRALIYESLNCQGCLEKARSDFEQVVRLEHDPNWVREAQSNLR